MLVWKNYRGVISGVRVPKDILKVSLALVLRPGSNNALCQALGWHSLSGETPGYLVMLGLPLSWNSQLSAIPSLSSVV